MPAEVPIIIPQPKTIEVLGGSVDLARPVCLEATGDISGGQAILREILESLGVPTDGSLSP